MQQNWLESIRVYSCLAESSEEASHVLIEACLAGGAVATAAVSAGDADALARSLQRAAQTVGSGGSGRPPAAPRGEAVTAGLRPEQTTSAPAPAALKGVA